MLRSGAAGCDGDQKYVFPEHNRWPSCRRTSSTTEECSCLVLTQIFYGSNKRCQTLVRLYHECFKAAFKVKWCNFLNWLLVSFWRCWVILSTLLTMTHHKPRYITTNSRPWNVVIEVFGQKYVDIWRPSADEERSCESLVEIGLNVNLNKNVAAACYYYYYLVFLSLFVWVAASHRSRLCSGIC